MWTNVFDSDSNGTQPNTGATVATNVGVPYGGFLCEVVVDDVNAVIVVVANCQRMECVIVPVDLGKKVG